jgi:hypothetical protein
MTAIQEKERRTNFLYALAGMCQCRGLGLAGPPAEISRLWMQYIAVTPAAGDIRKKNTCHAKPVFASCQAFETDPKMPIGWA